MQDTISSPNNETPITFSNGYVKPSRHFDFSPYSTLPRNHKGLCKGLPKRIFRPVINDKNYLELPSGTCYINAYSGWRKIVKE